MGKISLIIKREYLTRVKKKSFIIMTILGPILLGSLMVAPALIATLEQREVRKVQVIDQTGILAEALNDTEYLKFSQHNNIALEKAIDDFYDTDYYAILFIPYNIVEKKSPVVVYSDADVVRELTKHIKMELEKEIQREKLRTNGIPENVLKLVDTELTVTPLIIEQSDGKNKTRASHKESKMIIGYAAGFLIYIFIFMFGSLVMRGVMEEKTNRIVELIVSSVRPFQLMMGKIIGVAFVGLTQFMLWIILTFTVVSVVQISLIESQDIDIEQLTPQNLQQMAPASVLEKSPMNDTTLIPKSTEEINRVVEGTLFYLKDINFPVMLGMFLFFFLAGYLLYASLFAAIGSAVDNDTDTQQFMLPITVPLILAIIMLFGIVDNPDGQVAFWFSIIPFTSPITMIARIPFGVPYWEVALSGGLLILSFVFTTWISGKIYRTGILMYGKKIGYRELWKWIRYKS
ncbi:MAG: ABC transporter permease [Bacteroidetes bacterium]|nr:ABC transporter permease [Bacteroidota bacterium]